MQYRNIKQLITESFAKWNDDNASSLGASLAYYTVFSLAPLLIIIISIAGIFFSNEAVRGSIMAESQSFYGSEGADYLKILIENGDTQSTDIFAAIVGSVTLILGATAVFGSLKQSLNIIFKAEKPKRSNILDKVKDRMASLGMILPVGFLLIVSLVVSTLINGASMYFLKGVDEVKWLFQILDIVVSFGITSLLFGMIYRFVPARTLPWKECLGGGVVTATLFVCGKFLLGLYLSSSSISSAYGAAGSFVLILVWIYYSAQIFYFGAELVYAYSKKYGSSRWSQNLL